MTVLSRKVRRVVRPENGRRDLVVILHPGADPLVEVREKGRRSGYAVTVARLFTMLAIRAADVARAEKLAKRRAKARGGIKR